MACCPYTFFSPVRAQCLAVVLVVALKRALASAMKRCMPDMPVVEASPWASPRAPVMSLAAALVGSVTCMLLLAAPKAALVQPQAAV
jgi:hypothetical protein